MAKCHNSHLSWPPRMGPYPLCIDNSCTFCPRSADFLPRVQYQHGMCSLLFNSGTYTCYSIVFFVKDNQSIYYLRPASRKNSSSLCIDNSYTFCLSSADFLLRVQYQHGMCSLFVNSGTYTCYSIALSRTINLSLTCV